MGATRAAWARKEGRKPASNVDFRPFFRVWGSDNCARCWDCWGRAVADRLICKLSALGAGGNAPSNPYQTRAWPHALETVRLEKSPCALAQGAFFPSPARVSGCTGQDGRWQRPGVFRASGDDLCVKTYLRRCAALVWCEARDRAAPGPLFSRFYEEYMWDI